MSEEFDFGFFAVDEAELETVQQTTEKAEVAEKNVLTLKEKCDTLYNMVMPLLNNLALNPEKDYIYWPERLSKIEQFRDKLDEVYKG